MKTKSISTLANIVICVLTVVGIDSTACALKNSRVAPLKPQLKAVNSKLPLSFEVNRGQTDPRVKFLCRGRGYTLYLAPNEVVSALQKPRGRSSIMPDAIEPKPIVHENAEVAVLRVQLVGANRAPKVSGVDQLPGKSNYFIGNDQSKWHLDIPHYAKVQYAEIYPGVDLIYYGNQGQLEYDFVLSPGADPAAITFKFEGPEQIELDEEGDLILQMADGRVIQHAPLIYQMVDGARREIFGQYVIKGKNQVGFHTARYDANIPLVIDPVLSYSTYLGGELSDIGRGIAVDDVGNTYVTGSTFSITTFPTINAIQGVGPVANNTAFVTKFDADGTALVYSGFLGGTQADQGRGIAVDMDGNAYVTGQTASVNFPVVNPFQAASGGTVVPGDAFVTKINGTGNALIYSTYLGGSNNDVGNGIAVDRDGDTYVTGSTRSANFPVTQNAIQPTYGGLGDAFVAKLRFENTNLSIIYSTFLGGNFGDDGNDIAVDTAGDAYVTGSTSSNNFPLANAFQSTLGGTGTFGDAFVSKLRYDEIGLNFIYSTYLGGSGYEEGNGISVNGAGNAYVTGRTGSTDFPVANAFQVTNGGLQDAFVTKLSIAGNSLIYSTYLGGSLGENSYDIALDNSGRAYVTGETRSNDFPVTSNAIQPNYANNGDAFVTKFSSQANILIYSTYLGGLEFDSGKAIAVHYPPKEPEFCKPTLSSILAIPSGIMGVGPPSAYVTGQTFSNDFPVTQNAIQPIFGGFIDAFVTKISETNQTNDSSTTSLPNSPKPSQRLILEAYGRLPLNFEVNEGQTHSQVKFLSRGAGYGFFLTPSEAVLALHKPKGSTTFLPDASNTLQTCEEDKAEVAVLRVQLVGANRAQKVSGVDQLPGKSNYFIGNDPTKWRLEIPHYAKVQYAEIYPGVDLFYYGNQGQLEYDFVVSPGADPAAITFKFEGPEQIALDKEGDLILQMADGRVIQHAPLIYQMVDGARRKIFGQYVIRGKNQVGFHTARYDASIPLVIDPVLSYSTYLGGHQEDRGLDIALDKNGNAYVTGFTFSTDFPTQDPFMVWPGDNNYNAFVTKINPQGSALVYSTYLGGLQIDWGYGIGLDELDNAYVTGFTYSSDFPTKDPIMVWPGDNNYNAFVTKLNPQGSALVYSTYLGGHQIDVAHDIAVDTTGNAYVTGLTYSSDFPTKNPILEWPGDNNYNAFVTKINPQGSGYVYSTYLGGLQTDVGFGIAVDKDSNVYVTGFTYSSDFPTKDPIMVWPGDNNYNAFVTKLNPQGSDLIYSTYLGGLQQDEGCDICVDGTGNAYVTGLTFSTDFPTQDPFMVWPGDNNFNAFVTKLNAEGSAFVASSYLGGLQTDYGLGIAIDTANDAFVTGVTFSTDFPTKDPFMVWPGDNNFNAFVTKLPLGDHVAKVKAMPWIPLLLLDD